MKEDEKRKILDKIGSGEAYTTTIYGGGRRRWSPHIEDVIVLPVTKDPKAKRNDRLLTLFDNTTIMIEKTTIVICQGLFCPNDHRMPYDAEVFNIMNGKMVNKNTLCEDCKHMVEQYLGECREQTFKMEGKDKFLPAFKRLPAFDNYQFISKGYLQEHDFSNDIIFNEAHAEGRIEELKERGIHRTHLNKIRKEYCAFCVKYKTTSCKTGYRSTEYDGVNRCKFTPWELQDALEKGVEKDFGSMANAFWYFSQCGVEFRYMDKKTRRWSYRVLGVPTGINGEITPTGFFMSMERYPYSIGTYAGRSSSWYRHSKKEESDRRENYISKERFKKNFPEKVKKVRYKKAYKIAVLIAYMYYKHVANTPGMSAYCSRNANYLISIGINGQEAEVKAGNARYGWENRYLTFHDYFDTYYMGITKDDMKEKPKSEVQK
jgi:hypothetical protein